jgi:hypothetical protein
MGYTIGWNMPGYLPEMEPYTVDTADEAKRAMIDELLRHADQANTEAEAFVLTMQAEELNLTNVDAGWSFNVSNLAYWIEPVNA